MSEEKSELEQGMKKEAAIGKLRDAIIKQNDDFDPTILPLFIGAVGEVHRNIYKVAIAHTAMNRAINNAEKAGPDDKEAQRDAKALQLTFADLREQHFKDMPDEELLPMLVNYVSFIYKYTDRILLRDDNKSVIMRDDLCNTVAGRDDTRISTITPVTPKNDKTLSPKDRMRRALRGGRGEPDTFNIILLNSLILLRVQIPSAPDLIRLINSIAIRLQQYGEQFNVPILNLERAGIAEILVDFILDRLTYHSVKDVADHYELKRYILANDINPMVQGLLCTTAPKGVSFRMYCVADKCAHSAVQVIDPTTMILNVEEDMSEERRGLLYEIVNKGRKLSREELAANRPVYKDPEGKDIDTTIPIEGIGRMNIEIPYLIDYFETYASIRDRINPDLRAIAVDFPSLKQFKEKQAEYMSGIRGSEYIQWIGSIEYDPKAGEEGEIDIISRDEGARSFEEGLLENFADDENLYVSTLQKLITTIPRMSYTFIGIANDVCPVCKKKNDAIDHTMLQGFTPIDPITNFFDRTRMMIGMREEVSTTIVENLS